MDFQSIFNGSTMDPAGYSRILVNTAGFVESFGILESLAALKKPRFPFLCTHRFVPRLVFAAIYNTFAGSS